MWSTWSGFPLLTAEAILEDIVARAERQFCMAHEERFFNCILGLCTFTTGKISNEIIHRWIQFVFLHRVPVTAVPG